MDADLKKAIDGIDQRLDGIDQRLDGIDQRFDGIDQQFDDLKNEVLAVEVRLNKRIDDVEDRLSSKIDVVESLARKIDRSLGNVSQIPDRFMPVLSGPSPHANQAE